MAVPLFQDSSYLDELSNNNSLFSSPPDSLSDIADPKDFLPTDSLNHVPTLWDVNTPQQNQIEVRAAPFPSSQQTGGTSGFISWGFYRGIKKPTQFLRVKFEVW